jgi:PAS domain S-box-containing protein
MKLTGKEIFFDRDELIVTKTDLTGRITYGNDVFQRVAGYSEEESVGRQHNIIRHPGMPRAVFKLLWDTIAEGREIFAYVVNRTRNDDYYWVIAHVSPSFEDGRIIGYHSTRRVPNPETLRNVVIPLYDTLLGIEERTPGKKDGLEKSVAALFEVLREKGLGYDALMAHLMRSD